MSTCPTTAIISGTKNGQLIEYSITVSVICMNNQQVWSYTVTQLQGDTDAISNVAVEVCKDFTSATFINTGGGDFGAPSEGAGDCLINPPVEKRVKWDSVIIKPFTSQTFSFTLNGCYEKVEGSFAIKDGNLDNPPNPDKPQCFGLATLCTPGCNLEPPIKPPRGIPFSQDEKLTSVFRKDKK